jgi:hypothetical protein
LTCFSHRFPLFYIVFDLLHPSLPSFLKEVKNDIEKREGMGEGGQKLYRKEGSDGRSRSKTI